MGLYRHRRGLERKGSFLEKDNAFYQISLYCYSQAHKPFIKCVKYFQIIFEKLLQYCWNYTAQWKGAQKCADAIAPLKFLSVNYLLYLWLKVSLLPNTFTWCVIHSHHRLPWDSILSWKIEVLKRSSQICCTRFSGERTFSGVCDLFKQMARAVIHLVLTFLSLKGESST